jgi:hypothetical protein
MMSNSKLLLMIAVNILNGCERNLSDRRHKNQFCSQSRCNELKLFSRAALLPCS